MNQHMHGHETALVVQFAPIRRSSEEVSGSMDPQTFRVQSNQFVHISRSDEPISYGAARSAFAAQWGEFTTELSRHFDAVTALQIDYRHAFVLDRNALGAGLANVAKATAAGATLHLRRAVPTLGTLTVRLEPDGDRVLLDMSVLGHPGTPVLGEILQWVDAANALVQRNLASFLHRSHNAPNRTREVPLE